MMRVAPPPAIRARFARERRAKRAGQPIGPGTASWLLAFLGVVLLVTTSAAAGTRMRLERGASSVSVQFEDMTATEVVTELGARLGFKVVDLATAGPRSSRSLRAASVVGLLAQLLPAGGYAVTYRAGGRSEIVDKVVLLSASRMAGHGDGPTPPPVVVEHGIPYAPSPAAARRVVMPHAVGPDVGAGRSAPPAAKESGESTVPQQSSVPAAPAGAPVVTEEIRRFISQRVEVLVDAAREATLNGQRLR